MEANQEDNNLLTAKPENLKNERKIAKLATINLNEQNVPLNHQKQKQNEGRVSPRIGRKVRVKLSNKFNPGVLLTSGELPEY